MVDFSNLRKNRGSTLSKLTEKLETLNKGSSNQKDERLYKPGFDKKEGKGYAVGRFIPAQNGDPFVRVFGHGFKGKDGWYIENSRSTLGEEDPVGISNTLYWKKGENEGNETFKNIARNRKRNTKYYANFYVIKDTVLPEWNGKLAILDFGGQLFKKIEGAAKPEFEDDQPMDPFDMWSGADFKIKIVGKEIPDQRNGGKTVVPNYENSEFDRVSELFEGDDAKKEELFKKTYDLSEFLVCKPFDELAARFKKVTGEAHNALEAGDPAESVAKRLEKQADLDTSVDNGDDAAGKSDDGPSNEAPEPAAKQASSDAPEGESVLDMFKRLAENS